MSGERASIKGRGATSSPRGNESGKINWRRSSGSREGRNGSPPKVGERGTGAMDGERQMACGWRAERRPEDQYRRATTPVIKYG